MVKQWLVEMTFSFCCFFFFLIYSFQDAEVGSNLVKVSSTTATALKEKDGHVYCQPEVLYEGRKHPFSRSVPKPLPVIAHFHAETGKSKEGSWNPRKRIWGSFKNSFQHFWSLDR